LSLEANGVDRGRWAWLARRAGMELLAVGRGRSTEGGVGGAGPEGLEGVVGIGRGRASGGCWSRRVGWRGWAA